MPHSARFLSLLVVLVAGAPGLAKAQTGVLVVPAPGVDIDGVDDVITDAGFSVRDIGPVLEVLKAQAANAQEREQSALTSLSIGLEQARSRYLKQEWDEMLTELTELRRSTLWLTTRSQNRQLLWDINFHVGLAHFARGKKRKAREQFALANAAMPERRPPSDVYGPDLGQAYARAVANASGAASRPFRVQTIPTDATISIDGVALVGANGGAITPGLHALRVAAPGYETKAVIVNTADDAVIEIELTALEGDAATRLGPAWATSTLNPQSVSSVELLSALANENDAAVVLWIGDGNAVRVSALDADGRVVTETASTTEEAVKAVLGQLDRKGRVRSDSKLVTPENGGSTKKWLIVGGIGVAVVAVVATAVVLSSRSSDGGGDRVLIGIGQ